MSGPPIRVEVPGGGVVEFPADTDPATMEKALSDSFGHDTLGVIGQYSGRGSMNALNVPRDVLTAFIKNAPDIVRNMPGWGDVMSQIEAIAPGTTKNIDTNAQQAGDWVKRNFDVAKTYDLAGIPHTPPP